MSVELSNTTHSESHDADSRSVEKRDTERKKLNPADIERGMVLVVENVDYPSETASYEIVNPPYQKKDGSWWVEVKDFLSGRYKDDLALTETGVLHGTESHNFNFKGWFWKTGYGKKN